MSHGDADAGQVTPRSRFYDEGRFGRLFPTLPPFAADTPLIRDALIELGAAGGPMDAGDDLSDPVTLITDPAKSANNPNNPTLRPGPLSANDSVGHMGVSAQVRDYARPASMTGTEAAPAGALTPTGT